MSISVEANLQIVEDYTGPQRVWCSDLRELLLYVMAISWRSPSTSTICNSVLTWGVVDWLSIISGVSDSGKDQITCCHKSTDVPRSSSGQLFAQVMTNEEQGL